jgi:major membrane immunogen (membrane-anchored lipoprotein)
MTRYRESGRNTEADRLQAKLDREAVLGDYGTGRGDMDLLIMELNSKRPKEKDFITFYGEENIREDLARVKRIEESPSYQKERTEKSTLVEAVIAYGINDREWLGKGVKVRFTSKADDILRGVDMLVTLPHPDATSEKPITTSIAIDVTSSDDLNIWEKKLSSSLQRLDYGTRSRGNWGGQMTRLKYLVKPNLNNPDKDKSKTLYNHYIVTMNGKQADNLANVFCSKESSEKNEFLEVQAKVQLIYSLRHQAYLQLSNIMDMYCGFGQHTLTDYKRLPEEDKDDFEVLFDWISKNLSIIEEHLKEKWIRNYYDKDGNKKSEEQDNKHMFLSIKKHLSLVNYLENLLVSLVENKKEADTILQNTGNNGFENYGAEEINSYKRSDLRHLKSIIYHDNRKAQ